MPDGYGPSGIMGIVSMLLFYGNLLQKYLRFSKQSALASFTL